MERFTKGEWCIFGDLAIRRKGATEILASFEERGFNNKEGFANAHLIAAAPEMYEMLKSLREDYGLLTKVGKDIDGLLAKARGE